MAGYHMMELNNAHRWLPSEILKDIGIIKAEELHGLSIIEELTSLLVLLESLITTQRKPNP
jgi:hypothetical protein